MVVSNSSELIILNLEFSKRSGWQTRKSRDCNLSGLEEGRSLAEAVRGQPGGLAQRAIKLAVFSEAQWSLRSSNFVNKLSTNNWCSSASVRRENDES